MVVELDSDEEDVINVFCQTWWKNYDVVQM